MAECTYLPGWLIITFSAGVGMGFGAVCVFFLHLFQLHKGL